MWGNSNPYYKYRLTLAKSIFKFQILISIYGDAVRMVYIDYYFAISREIPYQQMQYL